MHPTQYTGIFSALERANVRYLIVGGVAVVLHGYLRITRDLDLVIELSESNLKPAMRALSDLGYIPKIPESLESFSNPATRASWIEDKNMVVFTLWRPDAPEINVDIFVREPFVFDEAYETRARALIDGIDVPVASIETIIRLKEQVKRPKDLEDIEALKKILALQTKRT